MSDGGASVPGDKATVTVLVAVEPAVAFEVFTQEIDLWWRRGPRYRLAGEGALRFEPGVGGRLLETIETRSGTRVFEKGRITVWDPPSRLVFDWRGVNFAPGEKTEVEVRFEPSASGTRVTVEHRGWGALRADHPARHGNVGPAFSRMIGLWWGDLATALRVYAAAKD
jgi:uncharacterized protein YndB with AHSA1/START domain